MVTRSGIAVVLALGLAACTTSPDDREHPGDTQTPPPASVSPSMTLDERRTQMSQVARDPNATVEDIVDAGGPHYVARVRRHTLVAWGVDSGGEDAGPSASAWRLYSPGGEVLAEGLGPRKRNGDLAWIDLYPLRDGFLVFARKWLHVRLDGTVTTARYGGVTSDTSTADVGIYPLSHVFVDGTIKRYRTPGIGEMILDSAGNVWGSGYMGEHVVRLEGGRGPAVPVDKPSSLGPGQLWPTRDHVVYATFDQQEPIQLAAWEVDHPERPARLIPTDVITTPAVINPSQVQGLDDGRLLVGSAGGIWWIGNLRGDWEPVSLPARGLLDVVVADDLLYAIGYADVGAWVSEPGSDEWRKVTPESVD